MIVPCIEGRVEQLPAVPGYDVLARLGGGASSTVWRARRHADGLVVALKVLREARKNSEDHVKRFKREDGHVWLLPHNSAYEPIPGDDATILGRVTTVLRKV